MIPDSDFFFLLTYHTIRIFLSDLFSPKVLLNIFKYLVFGYFSIIYSNSLGPYKY